MSSVESTYRLNQANDLKTKHQYSTYLLKTGKIFVFVKYVAF